MKGEFTTTKINRDVHQQVREYCVKNLMGIPYFYEMAAKGMLRILNDNKKKKIK